MDIPSEIRSKISEYSSDSHSGRSLNLTLENLAVQIEDLGLNPIDFIWDAINKERIKRSRIREIEAMDVGKLWKLIRGDQWTFTLEKEKYIPQGVRLYTKVDLPSSIGDLIIEKKSLYPDSHPWYHVYRNEPIVEDECDDYIPEYDLFSEISDATGVNIITDEDERDGTDIIDSKYQ